MDTNILFLNEVRLNNFRILRVNKNMTEKEFLEGFKDNPRYVLYKFSTENRKIISELLMERINLLLNEVKTATPEQYEQLKTKYALMKRLAESIKKKEVMFPGKPDFFLFDKQTKDYCLYEFKSNNDKLTVKQIDWIAQYGEQINTGLIIGVL
jgi:hypothetical protein